MQYSLLKNTFPKYHSVEKLENSPTINETPSSEPSTGIVSLPVDNHNNHNNHIVTHDEIVMHVSQCIKCRNEMMQCMSFYDKNRDIMDLLPYMVLFMIMYYILKRV
jgi:hypothetical protein